MADEWLTERLLARPPAADDLDAYRRMFLDPAIGEWLRPTPLPPFTEQDVLELLGRDEQHWAVNGFGPWALADRGDGAVIGRGGLRWTEVDGRLVAELPWTIASNRQREGLASEAAAAAIAWAETIELAELAALIRPQNSASLRVAEKVGLRRGREVLHAGLPHLVYSRP
jgi:RimJ/RimL family protein N-acetyltransferase